jgi:hypothetical protein
MTQSISKALRYVMKQENDDTRIGAFEKPGCLITMLANDHIGCPKN